MPAIVAAQFVGLHMEREGYVAVGTSRRLTARDALQLGRIASAVLKEDDLASGLQHLTHTLYERVAEMAVHLAAVVLALQVDERHFRQLNILVSPGHTNQTVLTGKGVMVGLDGRRSRSEQHLGALLVSQHNSGRTRMVTRGRFLLLVAGLMFLIDDDETQPAEGQENGRTGTYDQSRLRMELLAIYLSPEAIAHARMIDHDLVTKHALQTIGELGS